MPPAGMETAELRADATSVSIKKRNPETPGPSRATVSCQQEAVGYGGRGLRLWVRTSPIRDLSTLGISS